jgi:hypothetical protein
MENSNEKSSKVLNVILWIAQLMLAAIFLMVGFIKVVTPIDQLAASLPFVKEMPAAFIKFIGVSEILGGLGLLLPSLLRVKPEITVLAAKALIIVMTLALVFHVSRGEFSAIGTNIVLGAIALFISWGRSRKAVIHARA